MTPDEELALARTDAGIEEQIDDASEEVDELVQQVTTLEKVSGERHTELRDRIDTCQNSLERLLTTQGAENPILTQLMAQLAEIKAELLNLKLSLDTKLSNPPPKESQVETENPGELSQDGSTEEPSVVVVAETPEGETIPKPPRKNRFI